MITPSTGRNDPCPCGSGKKYKKCCLLSAGNGRGAAATITTHVTPETRRAVEAAGAWQVDIVPLPATIGDDPCARPGAVLVVANGFVLASEVLGRAPSEPDDVAAVLERAVRSVAAAADGWPATVEVRHAEIGEALGPRFAEEGIRVVVRLRLDDLERVAGHLVEDFPGWRAGVPLSSKPETWAGWGLPARQIADLFAAAADLWRAEPWVRLPNERELTLELPDGREWAVSILGHAGQEYGLVMYANPEDFAHLLGASGPIHPFAGFAGRMLSLVFDPRDSLPRPMQREVASAGWEVAAPDAYPTLLVTNTPAGGVSRRDADDLRAALRAVAALTREAPGALSAGERAEWREPRTGVRLVHHAAGDSPFADLSYSLWEAPVELSPAGPEGPGARPGSALELPADHGLIEALAGERGCEIWKSGELWGTPAREAEAGTASPSVEALQLRLGGGEWEDSSLESGEGIEEIDPDDAWDDVEDTDDAWDVDDTDEVWEAVDTAVRITIDRFFHWLLVDRGLSLATARKHARNAATFASFLFGTAEVPLAAVTEFDLRRFLFEWYPRKVMDATYRAEAMPVSLGRFFAWLAEEERIECPWAREVLAEREEYEVRYYDCPGGPWWEEDVGDWSAEAWQDLDRRVFLYDAGLGASGEWGEEGPFGRVMGPTEAILEHELERRWLLWRDEEIRAGLTEPDPLRAALIRRQRAWEASPHAGLDGLTPVEAIEREREERQARDGDRPRSP